MRRHDVFLRALVLSVAIAIGFATRLDAAPATSETEAASSLLLRLHSAKRAADESGSAITQKLRDALQMQTQAWGEGTALEMAQPVARLNANNLPAWNVGVDLSKAFTAIRDLRFMHSPERPNFLRRISWLYPDDGCFARAALAAENLSKLGYPRPGKVFVFGDLEVETPNAEDGRVTWWYHVAAAYQANNDVIVIDPSIQPGRPLKLTEWISAMAPSGVGSVEVALCDPSTYTPEDSCRGESHAADRLALGDQLEFLPAEWRRLISLHRSPERELGDQPPWLQRKQSPRPIQATPEMPPYRRR